MILWIVSLLDKRRGIVAVLPAQKKSVFLEKCGCTVPEKYCPVVPEAQLYVVFECNLLWFLRNIVLWSLRHSCMWSLSAIFCGS